MPIHPASRGSVLIICLAIVATLAVMAYGFVRIAQLHRETANNDNIRLLARQAAQTGTTHAIEQLLKDFATEAFTRMDSPGVRSFSPHDDPYTSTNNGESDDVTQTTGMAPLINVYDTSYQDCFGYIIGANGDGNHYHYYSGFSNEFGRARFYEPELYNRPAPAAYHTSTAPAAYAAAVLDPTMSVPASSATRAPVKFGSPYAAALDRLDGMFYDSQLRRVDEPDPRLAREKARYRLRYAITTLDLEGMLLVNGDQSVHHGQIKTVDPGAVVADVGGPSKPYITAADVGSVQRVVRNMHRLPAIIDAATQWGSDPHGTYYRFLLPQEVGGTAAEHVFQGRGSTRNVDKRADNQYAPSTFSYMYRGLYNATAQDVYRFGPKVGATMPTQTEGSQPATDLYAYTVGADVVTGKAAGGEPIPWDTTAGKTTGPTFIHILKGAIFSNFDYLHATYGNMSAGVDSQAMSPCGRFTPFGRGVSRRDPAEPVTRYRGEVDTPWCVNLLTATPRLVFGMVAGYMPPGAITARYVATPTTPTGYRICGPWPNTPPVWPDPSYVQPIGSTTFVLHSGSGTIRVGDTFVTGVDSALEHRVLSVTVYPIGAIVAPLIPSPALTQAITVITVSTALRVPAPAETLLTFSVPAYDYAHQRTRDLFVKQLSPAFRFEAPQRNAAAPNGVIKPDYHVDDFWVTSPATASTVFRGPADRYPGVMAYNGFNPTITHVLGSYDMLGRDAAGKDRWLNDRLGYYLRRTKVTTGVQYDSSARSKTSPLRSATASEPGTHANTDYWNSVENGYGPADLGWTYLSTQVPTPKPSPAYNIGAHPESIWEAIGQAMGATACMAAGQHHQYVNNTGKTAPDKWFNNAPWPGAKVATIYDVDALFVRNLGSNFSVPNDPTPQPIWYVDTTGKLLTTATPTWNLAALNDLNPKCLLLATNPGRMAAGDPVPNLPIYSINENSATIPVTEPGYDPAAPTYTATQRSQIAELIINDFRMSFFGASPQYANFRILDLNGDGKAACSCYPSNPAATAAEVSLAIDQYTTAVDANGVAINPVSADPANTFFSCTGTFILGKSRFWRIIVRGEMWDNVLNTSVDRTQLETILCIDPAEQAHDVGPGVKDFSAGMYSTHVLSQTWIFNANREFLPKRY